jgi:hypothetical protein
LSPDLIGKELTMSLYASWVHGNSALLERTGAGGATGKDSVLAAFKGDPGDIVDLDGSAAAACLRIAWAARFVVYDSGIQTNLPKSGEFWCHYAIPTPVIVADRRAEADTVLINYASSDISALSIAAVHVWDGNKRIFANDSPPVSADGFNGGIPGLTLNPSVTPNLTRLFAGDIQRRPIFFGVGVSLLIRAREAKDDFLEIRSVGIDFQVP